MASKKALTQTEIVNEIAKRCGLTKAKAKEVFTHLAELAKSEVKRAGEFTLPGFGKFVKATRKAREGRNPSTGAVIKIPAKTVVKFRVGKAMREAVAGK